MRQQQKLQQLQASITKGKRIMNLDILLGIARHLLTALGGVLVTKGLTDAATVDTAAGALITLAGFGWSVIAKWRARAKNNPTD